MKPLTEAALDHFTPATRLSTERERRRAASWLPSVSEVIPARKWNVTDLAQWTDVVVTLAHPPHRSAAVFMVAHGPISMGSARYVRVTWPTGRLGHDILLDMPHFNYSILDADRELLPGLSGAPVIDAQLLFDGLDEGDSDPAGVTEPSDPSPPNESRDEGEPADRPTGEPDKPATTTELQLVRAALADPRWDYRTVAGIVRDTGLSEARVRRVLDQPGLVRTPLFADSDRQLVTLLDRKPSLRERYNRWRAFAAKSVR